MIVFSSPGRIASLEGKRRHAGVASVHDCLYAVGGSNGTLYLEDCEKYELRMNKVSWIEVYLRNAQKRLVQPWQGQFLRLFLFFLSKGFILGRKGNTKQKQQQQQQKPM